MIQLLPSSWEGVRVPKDDWRIFERACLFDEMHVHTSLLIQLPNLLIV